MKIILIFVPLKHGKNSKNLPEQPSGKPYQ